MRASNPGAGTPFSVAPTALGDPFKRGRRLGSGRKIPMTPSQWVENFVCIKDVDSGQIRKMDFSERRYLRRLYDTPAPRRLLLTSRQTEKSTTLGNSLLANTCMNPIHPSLFVTPSAMQTKVFSNTRLDDIIDVSPLIKAMTHQSLTMNILEKEFINHSKIYLRYAFLSADRIRGLSVSDIYIDEIQDVLQELLPVIEETASHHQNARTFYSGTPKTFDNTIEVYWSKHSTQSEWVIPCDKHGTPKDPASWHWVILGPKNLGLNGPICDRCGGPLNPEHPMAQWVEMNPGAEIEGLRISRLMVPWFFKNPKKWKEILNARERYPTAQFMNEVMALSYDSGNKPLTRLEVVRACDDKYRIDEERTAEFGQTHDLYAGIDWGEGNSGSSYTVLSVGGYVRGDAKFQFLYHQRFTGPLAEPDAQLKEIIRLLMKFRIKYVGTDYGFGFLNNKELTNVFGPSKVHPFQYVGRAPYKVAYKAPLHRYLVFRSPVMSDLFQAIKKVKIKFPHWDDFKDPYADDLLSIRAEYNETLRMTQYIKIKGVPDDTFHSIGYAMLASMLDHRRPDIMAPLRENTDPNAWLNAAEDHLREEMETMMPAPDMSEYLGF